MIWIKINTFIYAQDIINDDVRGKALDGLVSVRVLPCAVTAFAKDYFKNIKHIMDYYTVNLRDQHPGI